MIDIEIDRRRRIIRIYDLDVKVAEGCILPDKFYPISFEYLEKILKYEPKIRKFLKIFEEV